jgi:hypothetical protein
VGLDSSVGIATCYGLDGPGIESRCRRDFPHPSRPTLGPTQAPIQWVSDLFPLDKAAEEERVPQRNIGLEQRQRCRFNKRNYCEQCDISLLTVDSLQASCPECDILCADLLSISQWTVSRFWLILLQQPTHHEHWYNQHLLQQFPVMVMVFLFFNSSCLIKFSEKFEFNCTAMCKTRMPI